jgi:hypothetical protein
MRRVLAHEGGHQHHRGTVDGLQRLQIVGRTKL